MAFPIEAAGLAAEEVVRVSLAAVAYASFAHMMGFVTIGAVI